MLANNDDRMCVHVWDDDVPNLHLTFFQIIIKMKSMHELIRRKALIFNNFLLHIAGHRKDKN